MPSKLYALSCSSPKYLRSLPAAIWQDAQEVFHGKIIEINENDIKFEVIKVYNGDKEKYKIVDIYDTSYGSFVYCRGSFIRYVSLRRNASLDGNILKGNAKIGDEWIVYGEKNSSKSGIAGFHNGRYYVPKGNIQEYYYSPELNGTRIYSEFSIIEKVELYLVSFIYNLPEALRELYLSVIYFTFYGLVFIGLFLLTYKKFIRFSDMLYHLFMVKDKYKKIRNCFVTFLTMCILFPSMMIFLIFLVKGLKYRIIILFINNPVTAIILTLLPFFVAAFISRKLYKYIKKRREVVSDDENI